MSPRSEKQFEEIRQSRRNQIIEAGLEIFAREGYHSASISMIAKRADISKGLLYNYFTSKEHLLTEILNEGVKGIESVFQDIEDELDTPEELWVFIKGSFEIMRSKPEFYKLYFSLLFQPGVYELLKNKIMGMMDKVVQDVAIYFKKKGDPYPVEKAYLLGAMLDGIGIQYLMAPEMLDLEKTEKIIFDLFK